MEVDEISLLSNERTFLILESSDQSKAFTANHSVDLFPEIIL